MTEIKSPLIPSPVIVYHYGDKRVELSLPIKISCKEKEKLIQQAFDIPINGDIFLLSRTSPPGVYPVLASLSPIDEYDVVWSPSLWETIKRNWRGENDPPPHPSDREEGKEENMPEFVDTSKEKSPLPVVFISRQLKVYHSQKECERGKHSNKILLSDAKKRGMKRCLYCKWSSV
jgi:hypothetical protein